MKAPNKIAEKAKEYEEAKRKADKLFEELQNWTKENGFEDFYISGFGVAKEPAGKEQNDGEYCDQGMFGEDSGDGIYYYPIKDSEHYMYVEYYF